MPSPIGYKGYQGEEPRGKKGRSSRRRTLTFVVVIVLVAAALIIVYAFGEGAPSSPPGAQSHQGPASYLTAPGTPCTDPSLPANVSALEASAAFTSASGGLCYNYVSEHPMNQSGETYETLVFNLYNGTVGYPCSTFPVEMIASQIEVTVTPSFAVESLQQDTNSTSMNEEYSCGSSLPQVGVVSVEYIEVTIPAVPEVNVTLQIPGGGQPIAKLTAVLSLEGTSYTFQFGGITRSSPLRADRPVSSIQTIGPQQFSNSTQIYPMEITGTLLDGEVFSYQVQVVITSTYAPT